MISTFLLFAVVSAAGASYRIEPAPQGDLYVPEKADRMTGRIYARSEKLPLRDYPMLWTAASSPWRALIADDGGAYFRGTVMTPEKAPVSFVYDGRRRNGFVGCEVLERSLETAGVETSGRLRVRVDATLVAEIEGTYRADFGETEYVL